VRVGVLALQGDFAAHARALERVGHGVALVRRPDQLDRLDGIVLPGGESTTQLRLLASSGLRDPLVAFAAAGRRVLATCAGLILLARVVVEPEQESLALLDVAVARNAWGRQLDSFEARSERRGLPLVFIRAPRIRAVAGTVEVLDTFDREPVLVRQGSIVGATFHPELTADSTVVELAFGGDRARELGGDREREPAPRQGAVTPETNLNERSNRPRAGAADAPLARRRLHPAALARRSSG
jgi:5'-phosphate synthase pdxT subunit